jgi:hypothetical protein
MHGEETMLNRIARLCAAASLLVALLPAVALADTEPAPTPSDLYSINVAFTFEDRGILWTGIAGVDEERLSGQRFVEFDLSGPPSGITCDAGTPDDPSDDYAATTSLLFIATTYSIKSFSIADDLSSGGFDVAVTGRTATVDPCTGEVIRSRADRHRFSVDLASVGPGSPISESWVVTNEDGSLSLVTQTYNFAQATGSARIDGQPATVVDANMQWTLVTVEPV